jgi:hypothetical protein
VEGDRSVGGVVDSLYRKAVSGDVGAIYFWLKNRRPSEWRDVQNINTDVGHYILSSAPMTEEQWIAVTQGIPQGNGGDEKPSNPNDLDDDGA